MAEKVKVTVVTMRDIFQDEAGRKSRFSDEYRDKSAQIILDKQDMASLGAKDGQRLLVKNEVGSVVVTAKTSEDDANPGLAFMNNSPWSNQLVSDVVGEGGIPCFKSIKADVSVAEGSVTSISDLLARMRS
jgi:formylmethanofuran dehydrogenase subunit D